MGNYVQRNRAAALDLWATRRYATTEIAELLMMREADVERIIHDERESRRRVSQ